MSSATAKTKPIKINFPGHMFDFPPFEKYKCGIFSINYDLIFMTRKLRLVSHGQRTVQVVFTKIYYSKR